MKKVSLLLLLFVFIVGALSVPNKAYAYLDPGSVTYVLQIVIALIIGGLVAIKIFWVKIKLFLSELFGKSKDKKDDN